MRNKYAIYMQILQFFLTYPSNNLGQSWPENKTS